MNKLSSISLVVILFLIILTFLVFTVDKLSYKQGYNDAERHHIVPNYPVNLVQIHLKDHPRIYRDRLSFLWIEKDMSDFTLGGDCKECHGNKWNASMGSPPLTKLLYWEEKDGPYNMKGGIKIK